MLVNILVLKECLKKAKGVENVIQEIEEIRSSYESIANVQEKATLAQFGIKYKDDSD